MIYALFTDKQVILATTALMHSVTAVMNLATLQKTAPARFLPQEHQAIKTDLIPGHNTPITKGTDHTPPTMGTDMGNISTDHNHAVITTVTGAAAVTEGTHYTPHPTTAVLHTALHLMDTPITTHTMTHCTGIVTPHPKLASSPIDITHTTIPWTVAGLTPPTLTVLHGDHS